MTIDLSFWASYGLETEPGQRSDVERQARDWAAAEPRIIACRIVRAERDPDRPTRWTVTVDVDFDQPNPDNLTLWAAS